MSTIRTDDPRYSRMMSRQHRLTRYELVAFGPATQSFLVGYSVGRSRQSLLRAVQNAGERIVSVCGLPDDVRVTFAGKGGAWVATIGPWECRYTGRTEREAITAGERSRAIEPSPCCPSPNMGPDCRCLSCGSDGAA